jgi:UDP-glucose 4-epimerase
MLKPLRIAVTGGAGFIGSHVADAYLSQGHHVVVIDDLSTGSRSNVPRAATFYKADIRDAREMNRIMAAFRPDVVNHQAAIVSVTSSTQKPLLTYEVNTLGTINLLIAAAPYIKKFILASTGGAMYSHPAKFPAAETESPTPLSPYGFSKQLAEEAVAFYAGQAGFDFTVLRYSNVFGPRQNPHGESGVMAIFSTLAAAGKKPTIYRRQTTRDYVYVGDVALANVAALTKGSGQTINIATGRETSNQQVYEAVAREFGWKQKPVYKPARPGELQRSCLAVAKANKVLNWKAQVGIADGLKRIHDSL